MSKNVKVDEVKAMANSMLSMGDLTHDEKSGVCKLLERILHETGSYEGYNYLNWIEKGHPEWVLSGEDDSQRSTFEKGNEEEGRGEYARHYF